MTSSPCDAQPLISFPIILLALQDILGILRMNTACNYTRNVSDPNSLLYYPKVFLYGNVEEIIVLHYIN